MQLKKRYKQTEFGIIPADWQVKSFNDFVIEFKGGAPLAPNDFKDTGFKVLPKGGVMKGGILVIDESKQQYCSEYYAENHKNNIVDNSYNIVVLRDLVPTGPSIGLSVSIKSSDKYILAQGVYGYKVKEDQIYPKYLIHLSNTTFYRKIMNNIMVGSTQVHITNRAYLKIKIPVPSTLAEQTAIATALSDMDELISGLEKLIEKKKAIKQGVMQELLRPKEGWVVKKLGDDIKFQVGFPFSSFHFNQKGDGIRLIKNRDLKSDDLVFYYNGIFEDSFIVNNGDVLISMDGEFVLCFWRKGKALLNQRVGRLIKKHDVSLEFLYYYLQKPLFDIEHKTSSTTVKHLSHFDIENMELPLPLSNEQKQIAQILTDIDSEIVQLNHNLNKYKHLKNGMMQELLTGKTRLI